MARSCQLTVTSFKSARQKVCVNFDWVRTQKGILFFGCCQYIKNLHLVCKYGLLSKNFLRVYLRPSNNINCQFQISSAESTCRCLILRITHQHGRKPFSWSVFLRFVQVQLYSLALGTSDCHPPVVTVRPDWLNSVGLFFGDMPMFTSWLKT